MEDTKNKRNISPVTRIRGFVSAKKEELRRQLQVDPKSYYRNYVASDKVLPLNERLVQDILSYKPKSVIEFGCGVGRNLSLLNGKVDKHVGIDVSEKAVKIATEQRNLNAICGDETILKTIENHDVAFTCSVLDHIEDIDYIVNEFKRIAKIAIVIAETNDKVDRFYFAHDYESLGFVKTDYVYVSSQAKKKSNYYIWHYKNTDQ